MNNRMRDIVTQIFFFAGLLALTSIAAAQVNEGFVVHVTTPSYLTAQAQPPPTMLGLP